MLKLTCCTRKLPQKFFDHAPTHTMCLLLLPLGPSPALFEGLSMRTSARRATLRPSEEQMQHDAEHADWVRLVEYIRRALGDPQAVELETARSEVRRHSKRQGCVPLRLTYHGHRPACTSPRRTTVSSFPSLSQWTHFPPLMPSTCFARNSLLL